MNKYIVILSRDFQVKVDAIYVGFKKLLDETEVLMFSNNLDLSNPVAVFNMREIICYMRCEESSEEG